VKDRARRERGFARECGEKECGER